MNKGLPFADDKEKMRDFINLNQEEFLASYSYLTIEDYEETKKIMKDKVSLDNPDDFKECEHSPIDWNDDKKLICSICDEEIKESEK